MQTSPSQICMADASIEVGKIMPGGVLEVGGRTKTVDVVEFAEIGSLGGGGGKGRGGANDY